MTHLKEIVHLVHLLNNGEEETGKVLLRGMAKQISKPLTEIVTNLLNGNIKNVDVKELKIIEDYYAISTIKEAIRVPSKKS